MLAIENERPVLLVVFGAGASHDSLPRLPSGPARVQAVASVPPWRPPLATQLFDLEDDGYAAIAQQFPEAIGRLNRANAIAANKEPIEEALQKWQEEAEDNERRFQQLAFMRFYLQELLWTCSQNWLSTAYRRTNYLLLTDMLEDCRRVLDAQIAYVTFNYDLLLEDALPDLALPTVWQSDERKSLAPYVIDDNTKVFKLHGSVNWAHPIQAIKASRFEAGVDSRPSIARSSPMLTIEKAIRIIEDPTYPVHGSELMFPALAIPTVSKHVFECPDDHIARLVEMVGRVHWILLVGWRATEEHFLSILDHHLPRGGTTIRVHSVGRDPATSRLVVTRFAQRLQHLGDARFLDASASSGGFGEWLLRNDLPSVIFGRDVPVT